MKVALAYDHVNKMGGAERVLLALHKLYPQAPLYTLVSDLIKAAWAREFTIINSFVQHIPFARSNHEFFPVLPVFAFEQFDFRGFDVVISITSAEAKGVITPPETLHISYILTPTRYLWSHYEDYFSSTFIKTLSQPFVSSLRVWDQMASSRPDYLLTISDAVRKRINKYYRRDAKVIYPPVNIDKFKIQSFSKLRTEERRLLLRHPPAGGANRSDENADSGQARMTDREKDYFLVVSRLVKYKHIEIAIEACNELKLPLKIVGIGKDQTRLQKIAGPTVEFLGSLTEQELTYYYQNCRAFLIPQEEDFGLSAVEALACGKPVIAYKGGGAIDIVQEGINGEFFYPQTKHALALKLAKFKSLTYSPDVCRRTVVKFSEDKFIKEISNFVREAWTQHQASQKL